jgi:hypothetical protein
MDFEDIFLEEKEETNKFFQVSKLNPKLNKLVK